MRIGGFVIHGNSADVLARCLDSLLSVCDEVVAVDSCASDGSGELVRARGIRSIVLPWRGYGAARAAAAAVLSGCDYLFFLDSDEHLAAGAAEAFARWRSSGPNIPHYRLLRRDFAELQGRRFLFRTERHVRLVRQDAATWTAEMLVHEALPRRETGFMEAMIEHRFADSIPDLVQKQERYAFLWAVRAHCEGRRPKGILFRRTGHVLRDCVLKGALFRGGFDALRLAWGVSRYHVRKFEYLAEIERGSHQGEVRAFREGRFADLFRLEPSSKGSQTFSTLRRR